MRVERRRLRRQPVQPAAVEVASAPIPADLSPLIQTNAVAHGERCRFFVTHDHDPARTIEDIIDVSTQSRGLGAGLPPADMTAPEFQKRIVLCTKGSHFL